MSEPLIEKHGVMLGERPLVGWAGVVDWMLLVSERWSPFLNSTRRAEVSLSRVTLLLSLLVLLPLMTMTTLRLWWSSQEMSYDVVCANELPSQEHCELSRIDV